MATIAGLFESQTDAQYVIQDLRCDGFDPDNISLIIPSKKQPARPGSKTLDEEKIRESKRIAAAFRAVAGGAVGGIMGVFAAAATLAAPVAGMAPQSAITILTGAALGAIGGGIIGALKNTITEIDPNQVRMHAESAHHGPLWVMVNSDERHIEHVVRIMHRHHAIDVEQRAPRQVSQKQSLEHPIIHTGASVSYYETMAGLGHALAQPGSPGPPPLDQAVPPSQLSEKDLGEFYTLDRPFREHYDVNYASLNELYEDYEPAYRYGYGLARSGRYAGRDWNAMENEIRSKWDKVRPATWERYKQAIRYGWDTTNRRSVTTESRQQDTKKLFTSPRRYLVRITAPALLRPV
jgi:hypothetical protein